ncbi:ABC-type nitrate/sulfonate/bicarbonate transport system, permease component [Thermomonospora echinospora]|uniref:ABC-type nitrate/sulfonate/bicarbonate transport system, permease component n=1 Tax=Thermomonospora echinospora TaxID=1992 RepID=A0A1H5X7H7_9ACTN|nr:ABC transporter permease [Thermomonospora echinospora]SEG07694.1 ABC-type nitrate/sulfonate/bicarbonate transport system, permease component [Thermomonospora echinospora]
MTSMTSTTAPPAVPARGRRRGGIRLAGRLTQRWLPFVLLVGVWEAVTRATASPFFPPPSEIVAATGDLWLSGPAHRLFLTDLAMDNLLPSLGRMLLALAGSAVVGIGVGIALGRSERVFAYLNPILQFSRAVPPPTLVPVFIVLFELGTQMQVASIIFSAIWPILLNTADGARSVTPLQMDTAEVFRLSAVDRIRYIIIPSALPKIFAGLRLALSLSLILMVFSELLPGTSNGIGFQLTDAQSRSDMPAMWSVIVLLGVLGYLLNTILLAVEHRVLDRRRPARTNGKVGA